jgi:hypothetical protein
VGSWKNPRMTTHSLILFFLNERAPSSVCFIEMEEESLYKAEHESVEKAKKLLSRKEGR